MNTEQLQRAICAKYNSRFIPAMNGLKIGLAIETLRLNPIHGVREQPLEGAAGWYIWGGAYSDAEDFFKPVHIDHLNELLPIVLPFLALEPGFKFITDAFGYEDVWRE